MSKHGLDAYNKLPAGRSRSIAKKSDFASEKQRASWVDRHGIAAYHGLPD